MTIIHDAYTDMEGKMYYLSFNLDTISRVVTTLESITVYYENGKLIIQLKEDNFIDEHKMNVMIDTQTYSMTVVPELVKALSDFGFIPKKQKR